EVDPVVVPVELEVDVATDGAVEAARPPVARLDHFRRSGRPEELDRPGNRRVVLPEDEVLGAAAQAQAGFEPEGAGRDDVVEEAGRDRRQEVVPYLGRGRQVDHAGVVGAHRFGRRLPIADQDGHGVLADVEPQAAVPVAGRQSEFSVALTPGGELGGSHYGTYHYRAQNLYM